jgi:hypothetical protein
MIWIAALVRAYMCWHPPPPPPPLPAVRSISQGTMPLPKSSCYLFYRQDRQRKVSLNRLASQRRWHAGPRPDSHVATSMGQFRSCSVAAVPQRQKKMRMADFVDKVVTFVPSKHLPKSYDKPGPKQLHDLMRPREHALLLSIPRLRSD